MSNRDLYSTVVVRAASAPIRLGDDLLGGSICAASVGNLLDDYATLEAENAKLRAELERRAVPDVSAMARVLSDRAASACCIDPDDNWKVYGQEFIDDVRAMLATPRQPEGDYGWLVNLDLPEVQCNCPWTPDSHDKTCPVYLRDRMADAQRAIAEMQAKLDDARSARDAYGQNAINLQAERDTLRQQRNKMVGLLMEADASFVDGSEAGLELSDRIHAALAEVSK